MSGIKNIKVTIVGDADFSKADAALKQLSAEEQKLINQTKQLDQETTKTGATIQANAEKNQKAVSDTGKSFDGLLGKVKSVAANLPGAFQAQQVLDLGKSVGESTKAVSGLSGSFNILKVAIAGTGIGALVIAFAALYTYFTQTEAGGDRLAKVMGGLKAIFQTIVNVVITLGEYVANVVSDLFDGFSKVYTFLYDKFIFVLRAVADGLGAIGFNKASDGLDTLTDSIEKTTGAMNRLYQQGQLLAEMEDALEDKTIKLALANAKLTTEIDQTLKALRNRTNTYQENLTLIDKVAKAEDQRLNNNISLIGDEIAIERQRFINQATNQQKAAELYDQYVSGRIQADEFIAQADGTNTAETVKNITDVLIKREEATRESLVLEERLNNLRDQFAQKEQQRQEARQKKILDNLKAEEAFALREAALRNATSEEVYGIQISYAQKRIDALEKFNLQDTNDYRDAQLKKQEIDQKYTVTVEAETKKRHDALLQLLKDAEADQEEVINEYAAINQKNTNQNELKSLKDLENQYLAKTISFQQYQDGIKLIQAQTAREQIRNEIDAIQKRIDIQKSYGQNTTKAESDLVNAQKKLYDLDASQYADAEAKKTAAKQKQNEKRKQIEQQAQQLGITLLQSFGQMADQQYQAQLNSLQNQQAAELAAVGDNKQAQSVINAKYAKQEAEIKRKQAQTDKDVALFQILINTAAAVVKAAPVIPLMIFAAAAGAAQAAVVASKPIPKFNKGTKSVPGVDTGDDSVLAMVRPGEGIMPVDRMKDYKPAFDAIFDRKVPASLLNSLVMNYDSMPVRSGGDSENRQLSQIIKKLDNIKTINVTMDQKGFQTFITKGAAKTYIENNYFNA